MTSTCGNSTALLHRLDEKGLRPEGRRALRSLAGLLLVASLAMAGGCARGDWIDRTLVTEDVSGVWTGKAYIAHAVTGLIVDVRLELEQQGPKVKGSMRPSGSIPWRNLDPSPVTGPIEGTVAGDRFEFHEVNGHITGRLTIGGDEMKGEVVENVTYRVELRRTSVSTGPAPPR